jgi:hypothetical protein
MVIRAPIPGLPEVGFLLFKPRKSGSRRETAPGFFMRPPAGDRAERPIFPVIRLMFNHREQPRPVDEASGASARAAKTGQKS